MVTVATDTRQRHRRLDDEQACHRGRLLRELEAARYELKGMEPLPSSCLPAKAMTTT
jgi:hypothetical protein